MRTPIRQAAFGTVILDLDGTLCDTRPAVVHCLRGALAAFGRSAPGDDDLARAAGLGLSLGETFAHLDPALQCDRVTREKLVGRYRALYLRANTSLLQAFPAVRDTLRDIHEYGVACVVVSNKGVASVRQALVRNGLMPFVNLATGEKPGTPAKPDPALLTHHILPRLEVRHRQHMLVVGDTEIDIRFARAAGLPCCWAAYGYGDAERCRALAPDYRIDSFAELQAIVLRPADEVRGLGPAPRG